MYYQKYTLKIKLVYNFKNQYIINKKLKVNIL